MPTDFYDLYAAVVARIGGEPVLGWLGAGCAELRAAVRPEALRRGLRGKVQILEVSK